MHSSAVERRIADPEVAGSIPVAPCNFFFIFYFSATLFISGRMPVWTAGA